MAKRKEQEKEEFITRTITIPRSQDDFLEDKCINLSKFVQKKIKEEKDESK